MTCPECDGVTLYSYGPLVPVWEDAEAFERGDDPDYLGCAHCRTMTEVEGTLTP